MNKLYTLPEIKVTGEQLISSRRYPNLRPERVEIDEQTVEYSVQSLAPLTREQLVRVLSAPLNEETDDLKLVREGIRNIAYPSRNIQQLGKRAGIAQEIDYINPAANELATILSRDEAGRYYNARLPVFNYGQSREYIFSRLQETDVRQLIRMLRRFGLSSKEEQVFEEMADGPVEVENIEGIEDPFASTAELHKLLKSILLNINTRQHDDTSVVNLIDFLQDGEWFKSFPRRDTTEDDVYIRAEDIPAEVQGSNKVSVLRKLHTKHKKTGLEQYQVRFHHDQAELFTAQRIAWRTIDAFGRKDRAFVFPGSSIETTFSETIRPNTIVGAARAALQFGDKEEYRSALEGLISKNDRRYRAIARAGLFPLVAHTQENTVLSSPYFSRIETALDKEVQ